MLRSRSPLLACAVAIALGAGSACSDGGSEASDGGGSGVAQDSGVDAGVEVDGGAVSPVQSLRLVPDSAVLVDRTGAPATQAFTVEATRENGDTETVVASLELQDSTLGRLVGGRFTTAGRGGRTELVARFHGLSATATIEVSVERTLEVPSPGWNPGDLPALFGSAPEEASRAPTLVYPTGGTLFPPNLDGVEIHFLPGPTQNEIFRVRFSGTGIRIDAYTRCTPLADGCLFVLEPEAWMTLADTLAGQGLVELSVAATDEQGTGQATSSPHRFGIGPTPVQGGLYYWSTSNKSIERVDFGAQTPPERYWPTGSDNDGTCYGCHALSPDGALMALNQGGQNQGQVTILDVATRTPLVRASAGYREQFMSWDPTSSRFAGIYGDGDEGLRRQIRIRNGRTGEIEESATLDFEPSHIDWSPTGDALAMTRVTRHQTSQRPGRGGITVMEREGQGWGAPRDLVPPVDGENHYTPAIAPDGSFVVFAKSTCPDGQVYGASCDADADDSSALYAVAMQGGTPIPLTLANTPGPLDEDDGLASTFPKWSPFVGPLDAEGTGRLMWLTFSSRRRYGLRPPVRNGSNVENQLLWMVGIDPDRILRGEDGSYAAFALPFQDLSTSNHIAQWTERVVPTTDAGVPDAGRCLSAGEVCDPADDQCCAGLGCSPSSAGEPTCAPEF